MIGIPNATVATDVQVYLGSDTKISAMITSCPPAEGAVWEKSSDSVTFETIDVKKPKYYGSTLDPSNPLLMFTKTAFEDKLYYRLRVWNKLGQCISNEEYLNVTGGMYFSIKSKVLCFQCLCKLMLLE
jgi:hypothetical protein